MLPIRGDIQEKRFSPPHELSFLFRKSWKQNKFLFSKNQFCNFYQQTASFINVPFFVANKSTVQFHNILLKTKIVKSSAAILTLFD